MLSHYLTISVIRLADFHTIAIQAGHPIDRDICLGILQETNRHDSSKYIKI